jgi:hypothetical protein
VQIQSIARPRISRDRAERLIHAYACRAARIMRIGGPTDTVYERVSQTRRELSVRIWADVQERDFWLLADSIAELRQNRTTSWDIAWDSPEDKDQQLGRLRQTIHAEIRALAGSLAFKAA